MTKEEQAQPCVENARHEGSRHHDAERPSRLVLEHDSAPRAMGCKDPGPKSKSAASSSAHMPPPSSTPQKRKPSEASGSSPSVHAPRAPLSPASVAGGSVGDGAASEAGTTTSGDDGEVIGNVGNKSVKKWMPRCIMTFEGMSPVYFQHILSTLEPASLSIVAMRGLCTGAPKHLPKKALCEVFEFISGTSPDQHLMPESHYMPYLLYTLGELSAARKHPAARLVLPPAWPTNGVYAIKKSKKGVVLTRRLLDKIADLPADFIFKCRPNDEVWIEANHSDSNAKVVRGYARYLCILSFPEVSYSFNAGVKPFKEWVVANSEELPAEERAAHGVEAKADDETTQEGEPAPAGGGAGEGGDDDDDGRDPKPRRTKAKVDESQSVPPPKK